LQRDPLHHHLKTDEKDTEEYADAARCDRNLALSGTKINAASVVIQL